MYCGYSYISCSAVPNVRFTTSTVSVHGHSHAASICALPVKWNVACCSSGFNASSFSRDAFRLTSNLFRSCASNAARSTAWIEMFNVLNFSASPGASEGSNSAAVRNSRRRSSGFGRPSGKSIRSVAPRKLFVSTVCSSFTATVTLSPGLAWSISTIGSRSSPMATRRPLK